MKEKLSQSSKMLKEAKKARKKIHNQSMDFAIEIYRREIDYLMKENKEQKQKIERVNKQIEIIVSYLSTVMIQVEDLQQEDILLPDINEIYKEFK